jgi:ethanolamine utilization protein EutN
MMIGRVIGTVVSTIQHDWLNGRRLLLVERLGSDGRPSGSSVVAIDSVDAGAGETVLVIDEGNSARQIVGDDKAPVRTVIVGVVDTVDVAAAERAEISQRKSRRPRS